MEERLKCFVVSSCRLITFVFKVLLYLFSIMPFWVCGGWFPAITKSQPNYSFGWFDVRLWQKESTFNTLKALTPLPSPPGPLKVWENSIFLKFAQNLHQRVPCSFESNSLLPEISHWNARPASQVKWDWCIKLISIKIN